MKKIILSLVLLLFGTSSFAQKKFSEATISYTIAIEGLPEDDPSAEMLKDATMKMVYKGDDVKMDMDMIMMKNIILMNAQTKKYTLLLDLMGQKFAIAMSEEEMNKSKEDAEKVKSVTKTSDSKKIAGYLCFKYVVIKINGDETVVWATTEIEPQAKNPNDMYAGKLEGFPLEYTNLTNGMSMKMQATAVNFDKVAASEYEIPTDYVPTNMEELSKKMGGN